MKVRVIRDGREPRDAEWMTTSVEERIEAVWTPTNLWLAWNEQLTSDRDFKELLLVFNAHNVEYLVVGAHVPAAYGHVRATKDLDVWIRPSENNA